MLFSEVERAFPDDLAAWREDPVDNRITGGENLSDVQKRAAGFVYRTCLEHPYQSVCFVSHAATITALICALLGWSLSEVWQRGRIIHANCAFTEIHLNPHSKKAKLVKLASTNHLNGASSVF